MLDFFVLGIVPGTQLQITFGWVIVTILLYTAAATIVFNLSRFAKTQLKTIMAAALLARQ
jgi:hypothetical protein